MISTFMMILGMISPILAEYYDYMKGLYISPYRINTNRIAKLRQLIAAKENKIAINKQKMENEFQKGNARKNGLTCRNLRYTRTIGIANMG